MGLLTGMVLAAAATLAPDAGSAATRSLADRFTESIVESKMKRVGVVPRFIQREGGKETLAGSMGPQGEWLADELVDGLTDRAAGRFKVVAPTRPDRPGFPRRGRQARPSRGALGDLCQGVPAGGSRWGRPRHPLARLRLPRGP